MFTEHLIKKDKFNKKEILKKYNRNYPLVTWC